MCWGFNVLVTIYFTGVVIGVYKDGQQPGSARNTVETIRDHLLKHNY